jgi:hypothetical protein
LSTWLRDRDFPDTEKIEVDLNCERDSDFFRNAFAQQLPIYPTIVSKEYLIESEKIALLVNQLIKRANYRFVFQDVPSHDASSFELTLGSLTSGISYRWWGSGPIEYQDLAEITMNLLTVLKSTLLVL